jgi:hypothetical protein
MSQPYSLPKKREEKKNVLEPLMRKQTPPPKAGSGESNVHGQYAA